MDKIFNHIVPNGSHIIKYGQLNEKISLELKMTTSLFKYIEVIINFYDDEVYPYLNNWTDVEGMGYGWAWTNCEENNWHRMMARLASNRVDKLLGKMDHTLYFVYENEKVKTYHFVCLDEHREDTLISFSDEEIDF